RRSSGCAESGASTRSPPRASAPMRSAFPPSSRRARPLKESCRRSWRALTKLMCMRRRRALSSWRARDPRLGWLVKSRRSFRMCGSLGEWLSVERIKRNKMSNEASPRSRSQTRVRSILVVEPDDRAGQALQRFLEKEGWLVRHVRTGRQALQALHTFAPSVLLTDCEGREIDSFELISLAAANDPAPHCVLFTRRAQGRILTPDLLPTLGIASIIHRPCSFEKIAATLDSLHPEAIAPERKEIESQTTPAVFQMLSWQT